MQRRIEDPENRWIVTKYDPSILDNIEPYFLEQGFMQESPTYTRVRQSFRNSYGGPIIHSTGDTKEGWGLGRIEVSRELHHPTARFYLDMCGEARVFKRRYVLGPHDEKKFDTIDIYEGHLAPLGLVRFERQKSEDLTLPPEIKSAKLVTSHLCDQQLAELNEEIASGLWDIRKPRAILRELIDPIKLIGITGPPGSGKTTVLKLLQAERGHEIHFMPEVARQVINVFGCRVPHETLTEMCGFEREIVKLQKSFYRLALQRARIDGKRKVITDRWIDPAAYLRGLEWKEKEKVLKTTVAYELSKLDRAIVLKLPSRKIYEKYQEQDPDRHEDYEQAKQIEEWILEVYRDHPKLIVVSAVPDNRLQDKFDQVREAIAA